MKSLYFKNNSTNLARHYLWRRKNKYFLLIVCIIWSSCAVKKFHNQKQHCTYELSCADSLLNNEYYVSMFTLKADISHREVKKVKRKLAVYTGEVLNINLDSLNIRFKEACTINELQLTEIVVVKDTLIAEAIKLHFLFEK